MKKLYETKFRGDTTHDYQKIGVPIGNAIMNKKVRFCTEAPLIKYHQKLSNSCRLSSLASEFHCIGYNRDVTDLVNLNKYSFNLKTEIFKSRIHFAKNIMKKEKKEKVNRTYNII